ncbi:hypothetical protein [Geoglobus acetivorans]|uniref:Uncharacterized protein n=1 Tax=Geoglobus acetivorans TaxID=565033 RepID=A0A0A7GHU6_GEOAI|nr:hypothetical protein GACE_1495 [Geoglobus acetivorans]
MNLNVRELQIFLNLLKYAYLNENLVAIRLLGLIGTCDRADDDFVFRLMVDNEKHKILLQEVLHEISYEHDFDISDYEKNVYLLLELWKGEVDRFDIKVLEKQAYRIYKMLLKFTDEKLKPQLEESVYVSIRSKILEILEDEERYSRELENI